ncbi:hypothetical protein [Solimonas soli]|uniref:hypothetical protein n=1 Tax=Solimonas soli TaxID=413479 RepID=UPI0012FC9A18|nr:hypothetical protein [Solimonas soli]
MVEVVRIPAVGVPTIGTFIENPLGFTRGHGISDDGRTFYIGGPDSDKGPSKTQIIRYILPDAQNVQRVV